MQLLHLDHLLLDRPPRQVWYFLRKKFLGFHPLSSFDRNHPCIFVLSTGRVGTETLAALAGLARNLLTYHEARPKLFGLSKVAYEHINDSAGLAVLTESFRMARWELLQDSLDCGRGYIETGPHVTFLAPVIQRLIPNARFIHLVRNPEDVVRSGMRRKWFGGNAADRERITPSSSSATGKKWTSYSLFQKNLWLWSETNRWILQFFSTLAPERRLLIHAEDIFANNRTALAQFYDFVSAPMPSDEKITRVLRKKINAQIAGEGLEDSVWAQRGDKDLFMTAGEIADALGYHLPFSI